MILMDSWHSLASLVDFGVHFRKSWLSCAIYIPTWYGACKLKIYVFYIYEK